MSRADAVVVGAGPNGLVAAALLAKAGRHVVVVERRDVAGGCAAGEEFHEGYRNAGLLHDASLLAPEVADALRLEAHGLARTGGPPDVLVAERDGPGLELAHDPVAARAEIAARSPRDAESYARFRDFLARLARVARRFLAEELPDPFPADLGGAMRLLRDGLALRRLGRREFPELLRVPTMSASDWLREWFETDIVAAALAGPALLGAFAGPRSPATAARLLRRELLAGPCARGGPAAIADALVRAATSLGVEIRTRCAATSIRVEDGRARGVALAGSDVVESRVVVAACDPRTAILSLLDPACVPPKLAARVRAFRAEGTVAKVDLALRRPVALAGRPGEQVARFRTGGTLDELERAFDAAKYGRIAESPSLDVLVPTADDPSRAPAGHAVASVLVHAVPLRLAGGWTDAARERLGDAVLEQLERVAPGLRASVVARRVLAPPDLEREYALPGGHTDHGEESLEQWLVRPARECARHRTPWKGLFLGGMGSWPGGGVTGLPGLLAARAALADGRTA